MLQIKSANGVRRIYLDELEILRHCPSKPLLEIGMADFHYRPTEAGMYRITKKISSSLKLRGIEEIDNGLRLYEGEISVQVHLKEEPTGFSLNYILPEGFNFSRLNIPAERDEAVYGGGVQFNHLNLRGRQFPIWTSEMGLGRHPLRPYTWLANWIAGAGGKYWNAYFPEPLFLSTRGYGCQVDTCEYSLLDFTHSTNHQVEILGNEGRYQFFSGKDLKDLLRQQASRLGIMPEPPRWVFEGGILGIQGGLPYVHETVERVRAAGAKLSGIWTQDWAGVRILWQGKRLFWNWVVDENLYPNLKEEIKHYQEQGIRWLTYVNPYFNPEGEYFKVARQNGFLVKDEGGEVIIHHIAGFQVGSLDLTNPQASQWFKAEIIQKNMLELGIRGWMADYAEDMPEQARFFDGRSGRELHNLYPLMWAQLNREAIEEARLEDEVLIFHRSGFTGATRFMNMNWGGDQVVYWNQHDGFPAGITGGLSSCMSGVQYYHTDAGGYFSFRWINRSKETLFRWCETNTFSPVLRTHEGNQPWAGVQPWQDEQTLHHFAAMTRLHACLAPYLAFVSRQAQESGIGMLRPFCLNNPAPRWRDKKDAYYLGEDLLVYPVLQPHRKILRIEIPEGEWAGLFDGRSYSVGVHQISCPIGQPVVLFRRNSDFAGLFRDLVKLSEDRKIYE